MDNLSIEDRRRTMRAVGSKHTKPEMMVRSLLHRMGYRFRLHRDDLPGKPDIVLPRYNAVIQVFGCFWHQHACPRGRRRPSTHTNYWNAKLDRNLARDNANRAALERAGWRVIVVWECELSDVDRTATELWQSLRE